jgi:hypothetical protein
VVGRQPLHLRVQDGLAVDDSRRVVELQRAAHVHGEGVQLLGARVQHGLAQDKARRRHLRGCGCGCGGVWVGVLGAAPQPWFAPRCDLTTSTTHALTCTAVSGRRRPRTQTHAPGCAHSARCSGLQQRHAVPHLPQEHARGRACDDRDCVAALHQVLAHLDGARGVAEAMAGAVVGYRQRLMRGTVAAAVVGGLAGGRGSGALARRMRHSHVKPLQCSSGHRAHCHALLMRSTLFCYECGVLGTTFGPVRPAVGVFGGT